ncbi:MAG: hypothetical protein ACE5GB_02100 [Acidimicrobiales bacterium]
MSCTTPFQLADPSLAEVADHDAELARRTRCDFFDEHARAGSLVAGTHFPVAPLAGSRPTAERGAAGRFLRRVPSAAQGSRSPGCVAGQIAGVAPVEWNSS